MNTQAIKTPIQQIKDWSEEQRAKRIRRLMNRDNIDMQPNESRMWLMIGVAALCVVVAVNFPS